MKKNPFGESRTRFPLFQSHLDLAHNHWRDLVSPESTVIDATCGNGHDTLYLAQLGPKRLYALDIQEAAIKSAESLLKEHSQENVHFFQQSHEKFPEEIKEATLVVYNLGYLPGGDKEKTTQTECTLKSVAAAQKLLTAGGMISITCYPGHPEGKVEEEALLEYAATLNPREWSVCHHRWLNRRAAPSLLVVQRGI